MQRQAPHVRVHEQLDPRFFVDYALFSGILRHYVAKSLEDLFKQDRNDTHRRLYVIGAYREEYAAYEDMGAILEAFIRYRNGEIAYPVEAVLRYKDDKVALATLFSRRRIGSADELHAALGLQDWISSDWQTAHPQIDCAKVLRRMCRFMFIDCQANQKRYGIDAYNRIKHGLALVPNGRRYLADLPNSPAVIIKNRNYTQSSSPYVLLGLPMDDAALEERSRAIEFAQSTLRSLVALYVIKRYPSFLREEHRIFPAPLLFNAPPLVAARDFLRQLSEKPEMTDAL